MILWVLWVVMVAALAAIVSASLMGGAPPERASAKAEPPAPASPACGMPYVTPQIDESIRAEMERLHQLVVPVQYVDNSLLARIAERPEVREALRVDEGGPEPFGCVAGAPYPLEAEGAAFGTPPPDALPATVDPEAEEVVPYNSIDATIAGGGGVEAPASAS